MKNSQPWYLLQSAVGLNDLGPSEQAQLRPLYGHKLPQQDVIENLLRKAA